MNAVRALQKLSDGEPLTTDEAEAAALEVMRGECSPAVLGALLMGLRCRGEAGAALAGFVKAMRQCALPFPEVPGSELVDTCGTGGDGRNSFNISTATALLLAACGVRVAKHGNRSASGRVGSADVLVQLGLRVDTPTSVCAEMLSRTGFCFLFAPDWHPGMKNAAQTRRELRVRTIFNLCGPLSNPARPTHQIVGVSSRELLAPIAEALAALGVKGALVVHGAWGHDEIALDGETSGLHVKDDGSISPWAATPEDFGASPVATESIEALDVAASAAIIREVLSGKPGPASKVVCANAGAVLWLLGRTKTLRAAFEMAHAAQRTGAGARKLEEILRVSRELYTT